MRTIKKVLVTGATGLVGSHLVAGLLSRGLSDDGGDTTYDVTAVAHSEESWEKLDWLLRREGLDHRPLARRVAALEHIDECQELIRETQPEVLFNCAARVSVGRTRDGEKLVTRNVEITHNLITAALELPKVAQPLFAHVSSIAALGSGVGPNGCIDESAVMESLTGASAYARSKFLSENEVWRASAHGLEVVVVNPAVILGPMAPGSGFWLTALFRAVRNGGNRFWLDGSSAFVSATDVAQAMILLSERRETWGKRYILSAENLSYRRFLSLVSREVGRPTPRLHIPQWLVRLAVPFAPSLGAVVGTNERYDGAEILRAVPMRYAEVADTLAHAASAAEKI